MAHPFWTRRLGKVNAHSRNSAHFRRQVHRNMHSNNKSVVDKSSYLYHHHKPNSSQSTTTTTTRMSTESSILLVQLWGACLMVCLVFACVTPTSSSSTIQDINCDSNCSNSTFSTSSTSSSSSSNQTQLTSRESPDSSSHSPPFQFPLPSLDPNSVLLLQQSLQYPVVVAAAAADGSNGSVTPSGTVLNTTLPPILTPLMPLEPLETVSGNASSPSTSTTGSNATTSQQDLIDYQEEMEYIQMWSAISDSLIKWYKRKLEKNKMPATLKHSRSMEEEDGEADLDHQQEALNSSAAHVPRSRRKRDEESVCYKSFGCFRDEGAFDYLDTLPGEFVRWWDERLKF